MSKSSYIFNKYISIHLFFIIKLIHLVYDDFCLYFVAPIYFIYLKKKVNKILFTLFFIGSYFLR